MLVLRPCDERRARCCLRRRTRCATSAAAPCWTAHRGSDGSGPREHDGPKERFSIETKGFIETTGPKIHDLEVPTELASELVLGNDGNGELGLFGSTERQN